MAEKIHRINKKIITWCILICIACVAVYLFIPHGHKSFGVQGKYAETIHADVLYPIVRVLDGDTLIANVSGHNLTIRLIGIDTPEVVDPRKPVQCYGPEASAEAKEILNGKQVYIEREENREAYDKYGRILAYIKLSDGSSYNKYMIEQGYAREYTYFNETYIYQSEYKAAQAEAQAEKVGLWGKCNGTT